MILEYQKMHVAYNDRS